MRPDRTPNPNRGFGAINSTCRLHVVYVLVTFELRVVALSAPFLSFDEALSMSPDESTSLVAAPGERIADAVFAQLRRAIARHELPPNSHLSVPLLATRFGISRSPVHEAVKRLVQEGLAVEYPRRGAFVISYNAGDLLPLYEMRAVLEGFAAGLAAERAGPEALAKLRAALERQAIAVAADDVEKHVETDLEFHQLLIETAGNPFLSETMRGLYARIHGAMSARAVRTSPAMALEDHRAILSGIEAHDRAAAEKAAESHMSKAINRLLGRATATTGA